MLSLLKHVPPSLIEVNPSSVALEAYNTQHLISAITQQPIIRLPV